MPPRVHTAVSVVQPSIVLPAARMQLPPNAFYDSTKPLSAGPVHEELPQRPATARAFRSYEPARPARPTVTFDSYERDPSVLIDDIAVENAPSLPRGTSPGPATYALPQFAQGLGFHQPATRIQAPVQFSQACSRPLNTLLVRDRQKFFGHRSQAPLQRPPRRRYHGPGLCPPGVPNLVPLPSFDTDLYRAPQRHVPHRPTEDPSRAGEEYDPYFNHSFSFLREDYDYNPASLPSVQHCLLEGQGVCCCQDCATRRLARRVRKRNRDPMCGWRLI